MSQNRPNHQSMVGNGIKFTSNQNSSYTIGNLPSVSPIRFNPEPQDGIATSSSGSLSTLSSSRTPETIILTIKNPAASNVQSIKPESNSNSSIKMSVGLRSPSTANPRTTHTFDAAGFSTTASTGDTIISAPIGSGMYQAPSNGKKLPGKLTTQYVMADGSVITGKGLGRGRPGVRRGPRKSIAPGDESVEGTPSVNARTPNPPATPMVGKRKRSNSESSQHNTRSFSSSLNSRESSVEYEPTATQTRSGRQTQKPTPILPPASTSSTTASPAVKKTFTPVTSTPILKTHPKIKRKVYRGKEQFALCEHCLRGFGPVGNVIVFCDACNKCWHQRCHTPQITKEIVADANAEWFCATCDKILHGNKKLKKQSSKPEATAATITQPPPPPQQKFAPPFVGAIALTLEQRKKYLETLNRDQLVNLLLRAGELAPQMPIFETPIPLPRVGPLLQPQFTSDYITPVTGVIGSEKDGSNEVPDEGYDDSFDEHAILYPSVGEGVQLPPEREDLNMLLEGPESRTFSHWVKGLPVKTVVDTVPLHQSQFQHSK